MALEASSSENGSFRSVFENNMPPSRKPISHDSAAVLLLSYDSNDKAFTDLNVQDEIDGLEHVFYNDYGFQVEKKVIGSNQSAEAQMVAHLANFVLHHGKEHALLIVYYGGHGSRSDDERRPNPGRFDLHPKRNYPKSQLPGEGLIMWEACENTLHNAKGDVLVIFDSCDTGSLIRLRSTGCAFEYFGACKEGGFTHGPGENSFTTALTWALKELRSQLSFTTDTLAHKVKEYERFPRNQNPVLFTRMNYVPEHIWISSRGPPPTTRSTRRHRASMPEFRDENCDYVDFRVTFNRSLSDQDGKDVATLMAPLITNQKLPLSARHVSVIRKGTCKPSGARWTLLRNHLLASQRFQATTAKPNHLLHRKRKRISLEIDDGDTSFIDSLESISASGADESAQLSQIVSSAPYGSSLEHKIGLQSDVLLKELPTTIRSPAVEKKQNPLDRAKPILKELQELMKDVVRRPELCSSLRAQIREVIAETTIPK